MSSAIYVKCWFGGQCSGGRLTLSSTKLLIIFVVGRYWNRNSRVALGMAIDELPPLAASPTGNGVALKYYNITAHRKPNDASSFLLGSRHGRICIYLIKLIFCLGDMAWDKITDKSGQAGNWSHGILNGKSWCTLNTITITEFIASSAYIGKLVKIYILAMKDAW